MSQFRNISGSQPADGFSRQVPQPPEPLPQPEPKKRRRWVWPLVAGLALLAGIGIGQGTPPEPTTVTKEVVRTVPGPVKTVTKVETKTETPQSCIDAIDAAENGFDLSSQGFTLAGEAMQGAANLDVNAIEDATAGMQRIEPELTATAQEFNRAKTACRAAR